MLKYGKAELSVMEAVLEQEYETVGEAARAALLAAEEIFAKRASFVVVGQVCATRERPSIPPDDPEAVKVALGWYSTAGDARAAAESLWHNTASGDTFRTWVLPTFHGTAADLHAKRREELVAADQKAKQAQVDRIHQSIEKRRLEAEQRAAGKGACECQHQPYEHLSDGSSRGRCGSVGCPCTKFRERKKAA